MGPAKYLPHLEAEAVRELEAMTVSSPAWRGTRVVPAKTEYLRRVAELIGWDEGKEAVLSYVECSGGILARSFHGRPMNPGNRAARRIMGEVAP